MPKPKVAYTPPSPFALARAMAVLATVREELLAIDPNAIEDVALFQDTLEGEGGDALDLLANVVRQSIEAEALAEAVKTRKADLAARQTRFERRQEVLRRIARDALQALGLPKLEMPDFTASVANGRAKVLVTDDKALPDAFVRITRAPDREAIGEILRAGKQVRGATLSNPEPTLTVRAR